jgi:hypothetical protein
MGPSALAPDSTPGFAASRDSRYDQHPIPDSSAAKLTLAPAELDTFRLNWYPAIGSMLAPTVTNSFELPAGNVKPVGAELFGDGCAGRVLTPGALWKLSDIEAARITRADLPTLRRIVVAIDPAVSNNENSDETGIVVAGRADLDDNQDDEDPAERKRAKAAGRQRGRREKQRQRDVERDSVTTAPAIPELDLHGGKSTALTH